MGERGFEASSMEESRSGSENGTGESDVPSMPKLKLSRDGRGVGSGRGIGGEYLSLIHI